MARRNYTGPRYELGSPEWMEAAREYFTTTWTPEELAGASFTRSFEMADPPAHLRRPGRDTIGYYYRVKDGKVEFGDYPLPPEECDSYVWNDYEAGLTLRKWNGNDPGYVPYRNSVVAAGKLKIVTRNGFGPDSLPRAMREADAHNAIGDFTILD